MLAAICLTRAGDAEPGRLAYAPILNALGLAKTIACIFQSRETHSPKTFMGTLREPDGDLLQGTLDMLVLKILVRGPLHGYAIAELIHERSDDVLRVEEGALYPALHRLELRGWLAAEWGVSENNRRAKFYKLTVAGRRQLEAECEHWSRMSAAIARVMRTA